MLEAIIILVVGVFIGILVRNSRKIIRFSSKATEISVYALLFFLGIGVGSDDRILQNLDRIGVTVVLVTLSAVAGSVLLSFVVYHFFFNDRSER